MFIILPNLFLIIFFKKNLHNKNVDVGYLKPKQMEDYETWEEILGYNPTTSQNIIDFYFGVNAIKSTTMHYTRVVKSQTLSTKKLRALLRVKKNEFHLDTKNQLILCKKFFF